jgi:hypothetical protein
MTEEVKNEEAQTPAAQTAEAPATELNINDLAALRSIVDVASTRGAFKAAELEAVGKVYNKLSSFLDSVAANAKKE